MLYPVSQQEILALINASNPGSPLKASDLSFVITGQEVDGTTTVEVTPASGVPYYGKRTITYRKRDLAKSVLGVPVRLLVTQNLTVRVLVEMFAEKYGYTFSEALDFTQAELDKTVDFGQAGVQVVEIPAAATSLVWIGKLSISVSNDALDLNTIIANIDLTELRYLTGDTPVGSIVMATGAGDFSALSTDIEALAVGAPIQSALATAIVASMAKQGLVGGAQTELNSALVGQTLVEKTVTADNSKVAKFAAVNNNVEWAGAATLLYGKYVAPTEPENNVFEFTVEQGHLYINLGAGVKATINYGNGTNTSTSGADMSYDYPNVPTSNLVITVDKSTLTPGQVIQIGGNAIKTCERWVNHTIGGIVFGEQAVANSSTRLTKVPATLPESFTTMANMFWGCSSYNGAEAAGWDTKNITNLSGVFRGASKFNRDISNWNTAKVTNMSSAFMSASIFNQPIGKWNTANVTTMGGMFTSAVAFNQDLSTWNTSKVTVLSSIFSGATVFNGNIDNWDVSKVTTLESAFQATPAFNRNIGAWNTGNVTTMYRLFSGAGIFNQNLSGWNVTKVTNHTDFDKSVNSWAAGNKPVWVS